MRVAVVRDSDVPVRGTDEGVRGADEDVRGTDEAARGSVEDVVVSELRAAVVSAGHEVVEVGACEAMVVALTAGGSGLARRTPGAPCIAVFPRSGERRSDEADRSSVESNADAFVQAMTSISEALAWVTSEDRAERTRGQPRLTVVGTARDDFGMSRPLVAEPMIIGRSSSFAREHPQRPDRMPTPTGMIARHHAQVRCVDGVVSVRDLRSTNGTLVIRYGEPARLLCPQEQSGTGHQFGPPASPWIVRDPSGDWVEIRIGDHVQMCGFWRFRIDGDPAWRVDD